MVPDISESPLFLPGEIREKFRGVTRGWRNDPRCIFEREMKKNKEVHGRCSELQTGDYR